MSFSKGVGVLQRYRSHIVSTRDISPISDQYSEPWGAQQRRSTAHHVPSDRQPAPPCQATPQPAGGNLQLQHLSRINSPALRPRRTAVSGQSNVLHFVVFVCLRSLSQRTLMQRIKLPSFHSVKRERARLIKCTGDQRDKSEHAAQIHVRDKSDRAGIRLGLNNGDRSGRKAVVNFE
ncbi:hypothetical protein F2P81_008641 [Scophthalmus maximus]|uniref:Uncharacterized protein n=1 Tax=Scophthalmus maximus TaxID=52904 RepID=A0A6A4SX68_SCOMX|nr:hypothetical protein F2P81_008641 [Scophthalmus maximus]